MAAVAKKQKVDSESRTFIKEKLCGVTNDGATAVEAIKLYCIICQKALCSRSTQLGDVSTVVKTINLIRSRAFNYWEFWAFLLELDVQYCNISCNSYIHSLSHGTGLEWLCSPRSKI